MAYGLSSFISLLPGSLILMVRYYANVSSTNVVQVTLKNYLTGLLPGSQGSHYVSDYITEPYGRKS